MGNFIGTSGWSYDEWKGGFYPSGVSPKDWLSYYASQFNTVEINTTFYRLPTLSAVESWAAQTPDDFVFSAKLSQLITHFKRLIADAETRGALEQFFTPLAALGGKLNIVLVQLPVRFPADNMRLGRFIEALEAAIAASGLHPRVAIEFRHESWFTEATFALLRAHNIANVWNSGPASMASNTTKTADFIYARFHGTPHLYKSLYTADDLRRWAHQLAGNDPKDICAYFNNTMNGHAIANARQLRNYVA